jgi:hypothetical protein
VTESYKSELKTILKQNGVTDEDLNLWSDLLNNIPDEIFPKFKDLFALYPDSISFTNELIKDEKEAFAKKDENEISRIFNKIQNYLVI